MTRDKLSAGYDLWAATYDGQDNPLVAMSQVAMTPWLETLAGRVVVELGCGTGRNAVALLAAGARQYVGIDASPGMLAVARGRELGERATFRQGDLTDPQPDLEGRADAIFFCLVLEHVADLGPPLARAASLAAPGAELALFELDAELQQAGTRAHFRHGDQEIELASFPHSPEALTDAARAAGFTAITTTRWRAPAGAPGKLARHAGRVVLTELRARR